MGLGSGIIMPSLGNHRPEDPAQSFTKNGMVFDAMGPVIADK
jgi:hypothetical protein